MIEQTIKEEKKKRMWMGGYRLLPAVAERVVLPVIRQAREAHGRASADVDAISRRRTCADVWQRRRRGCPASRRARRVRR